MLEIEPLEPKPARRAAADGDGGRGDKERRRAAEDELRRTEPGRERNRPEAGGGGGGDQRAATVGAGELRRGAACCDGRNQATIRAGWRRTTATAAAGSSEKDPRTLPRLAPPRPRPAWALEMKKGFQDKALMVLSAKVDAAQGAVGVSLVVLAEGHEQLAIAVRAAAAADVVKDATARRAELALEANKAAFEDLEAREAVVDVKTAATTTLAAELTACREVAARAVAAHDILSRSSEETLAKMSNAEIGVVRLRERFDSAAGASTEEGADVVSPLETGMIAALDEAEAAGPNAAVASAQAAAVAEVAEDDAGAA